MTTLTSGQVLGPYRIIEQVGQGGMATVYKAYHAAMDRYVAIKILPFQFAQTGEFVERFQREVRVIAHLEHPHILPVYDSGESSGVPYLVMRYMDTGTLKERIQAGPLSLEEIDPLFTQLADALGYAHTKGIIHRDIKPSNVLLNARGDVFLTDFGIARLLEGATQLTASGTITGTPAYMSPEQAQGETLDPRSDIYSLGIVLYEMITGRVPFEAETPLAVILKHLQASLPLPSTLKPGLDPAIERVLLKALARDREERFRTTAELIAAWKEAVQIARQEVKATTAPSPAVSTAPLPPRSPAPQPPVTPPPPRSPAPSLPVTPAPSLPIAASPPRSSARYLKWITAGAFVVILILLIRGMVLGRVRNALSTRATLTARVLIAAPIATAETTSAAATASAAEEIPTNTPRPGATAVPTKPAGEQIAAPPGWQSWTAANTIYTIVPHAGQIYAGGPGGVTIWNPADGSFQRITTRDGLPGPLVNALFFDADGSLWIGTESGLARFDGINWTIYNDRDGLDSYAIRAITRYNGQLVVGTAYCGSDGCGLNLFDGRSWKPIPNFPSAGEDPNRFRYDITALLPDEARGGLWVGTPNGLGWYDGATWTRYTTAEGLPEDTINALTFDKDGLLLVATARGAALFDGQQFTPFEFLAETEVRAAVQDHEGRYWFAGWGITRFDPVTGNWDYYDPDNSELPAHNLISAAKDENGVLYFGSERERLVRYDGEFSSLQVSNVPRSPAFWSVLPAPDGKLWFTEEYGLGIDVYDPQSDAWSVGPELPCTPLDYAADGAVWCVSELGLWIISGDSRTNLTTRHGLPSDQVWAVAFAADGRAWVGTEAGLAILDGQSVAEVLTSASAGFASNSIQFIFRASDGSMWIITDVGVSRRTPTGQWEHFANGNPFSENFWRASRIVEDPSGALWLATYGDGVYRFANGEWKQYLPTDPGVKLPSTVVNNLTLSPDGSLWFATDRGAARFDGQTWTSFGVQDGLIFPFINDIYVDSSGAVWFATSGGVSRYAP